MIKTNFATRCFVVPLALAAGLLVSPTAVAQEADGQSPPKLIRLRSVPTRDAKTMPAVPKDETKQKSKFELTQQQEEFFKSVTARVAKAPQEHSSGVYLDFLSDTNAGQGFAKRTGFAFRDGELENKIDNGVFPVPLGRNLRQKDPRYRHNAKRLSRSDEYVYDGSDREARVQVDGNWNIYGMDTEDTFGHFDTLDGKRLVSPSNRVDIYAPRFSAVRRVDNLRNAQRSSLVTQMKRKEGTVQSRASDFSSSTKQNISVDTNETMLKAVGFRDQTRGVLADNVLQLRGSRKSFHPYENFDLMRLGKHSNSETSRLEAGMQAANVWQDNLGLQAFGKKIQPIIVNDTVSLQQIVTVETDDDNAILRVTKVASRMSARPGEEVEFTIRFDNLSARKIGNVTVVDNLTNRLQYVSGTAECSIDAKFIHTENDASSLTMRWEIDKPIPPGKGGVIRFKCRVR